MKLALSFQPMTVPDIDRIMQIEQEVCSHPWTHTIFADCIRVGYNCWLAQIENTAIAYAITSLAADESHILNIAVASQHQNQGIGKQFIAFLVETAKKQRASMILLEVRKSNSKAIHCYNLAGFHETGCRKDYYPAASGREDALLFAREIEN